MISRLGKYDIRRELGRGAMGVVYEGFDPLIARVVALKTIRSEQLAGAAAADIVARFRQEAQAAGRLSHPNVVSIYDFGEDNGVWFIAMEFVKGRELKESFDAGERFSTADAVRIMAQILSALAYSHRQGVVHRDIKPANIILLADGTVKVADFGIAHIEASELTQLGTVLGTPSYMSPEQILGLPVDGRADLFSAGVILYQFLTGDRPFTGSATTTVQKVLKEDPLPPSALNVQVLPAFDAIVRRALAKRPEDRFADADQFAAALRAAADAEATAGTDATMAAGAVAPGLAAAAATTAGSAAPPASPKDSSPAAPASRTRTLVIAAAAGLAAVAVAAGLWFTVLRAPAEAAKTAAAAVAPAPVAAGAAASATAAPPSAPTMGAATAPAGEPGTMLISAVGVIDPADPRFRGGDAARQGELRKASQSQLVEKALALFVDPDSLARNYDLVNARLLSKSDSFITRVVQEGEPSIGKDGLMTVTTEAMVNVKALQKAVNQMSRDERVEFIRARGDPKISVRILARSEADANAPARPSPVAENIVKAEIKSFGFRTWSDDEPAADGGKTGADFAVSGEVALRRLSTRLEASGLVIDKYVVTSATVKCVDRVTGEEIYYNTALPKGGGSASSEDEALKAIGTRMAKEFTRDFFLAHLVTAGQPVRLEVTGLPDAVSEPLLTRELAGLPAVITIAARRQPGVRVYDVGLAGAGALAERIARDVLKPLNAKLGQECFRLGAIAGEQVGVAFDPRCTDAAVLSRLETYPPAWLYAVTPGRQRAVTTNPDTLRKLTI